MAVASTNKYAYVVRMPNAHAATRASRRGKIPINVSLDADLVAEARELGVNISRASAAGLENAVASARAERWLGENRSALRSSNAYVDTHDLPLKLMRQF